MKKSVLLLLSIIPFSAHSEGLQNLYGLGVLETASGNNSNNSDRYIEIMVGRSSLNDFTIKNPNGAKFGNAKFDTGISGSLSYGTEFMDPFLWEIELGYNENDVKLAPVNTIEGTLKAYTVMGNLLLEADFLPVVQPFFGAGAGYARLEDIKSSDDVFAYQGIGGFTFDILDNIDIVAEYKYLRADDVEFNNSGTKSQFDYVDQNVEIGVRFGL